VKRLRLFRYLLLALLVPFVAVLVFMIRQPVAPHSAPYSDPPAGPRAEEIEFLELSGESPLLALIAGSVEQDEGGTLRLKNLRRLEVNRKNAAPLIVQAQTGTVAGSPGQRLMRLEGGVEIEDEEEGLSLSIPTLEVNEAVGEARSLGAVSYRARNYEGEADAVIYGLNDQPTILIRPTVSSGSSTSMRAERATLLDGTRDFQLDGDVRVTGEDGTIDTSWARIGRDRNGQLRSLSASGGVWGTTQASPGLPGRVQAERADVEWAEDGQLSNVVLEQNALVEHGESALAAQRIEATRDTPDRWTLDAWGMVRLTSPVATGQSVLTSSNLSASLGGDGTVLEADAEGNVRFDSPTTSAEAGRASYDPNFVREPIVLRASSRHRARLAQGRNRIAADTVATNPQGTYLRAEGRVEASLLPADPQGEGSLETGLFRNDKAVHFVSSRLEGNPSENRLSFAGAVRGWQGERNLAADRVDLEQEADLLIAIGHVTTRIPRAETGGVSEADFIQIGADRLDYRGEEEMARYTGNIRVRQAEGWLQARELEVDLSSDDGGVKEIRAAGEVRFEFRTADREGMPTPVTGSGDRLVYLPAERVVVVHGERTPASVWREGEGGGTTTGRVLRYRMDTGALEVQSGDRDRARIRTSGD
jgi:lipopolysaccharide transport protein LptA